MSGSPSPANIRRMREGDLDKVLAIAAGLKDAPHWPRAAYLSALDKALTPRRIALVAVDSEGNAIAGFAIASLLPPQAELELIAVSKSAQRRGIGRALFTALADELRAVAVSEFLLEVRASNQQALAFYRSLGWIETGRRPRYYANPQEDAVLLSLALG